MSEANEAVSNIAEKVIYLVPVFGILLVLASDGAIEFGRTFVWLSLTLFILALGVSHSVLIPGHRKINALLLEMEQGPPPTGARRRSSRRSKPWGSAKPRPGCCSTSWSR